MRRFYVISKKQFEKDFKNLDVSYEDIKLPERKTMNSAGYDFYVPFSFSLKPGEIITIPTGIKVEMNSDEFLGIYIRSSIGFKYNVRICNQVGIIDSDYYNNIDNEGHMFIKIQNEGNEAVKFNKNDRIAQGIFQKYFITDNDNTSLSRIGGLGSTKKGDDFNG